MNGEESGGSSVPAAPNKSVDLQEMLRIIRGVDEATVVSDEDIQESMLQRMLAAGSWEELVTPQEVVPAKSLLDQKLTFWGAHLMNSTFADGPKVYMIIDIEHDGKRKLMSCGSSNVMNILAIAMSRDWLPAEGIIRESPKVTKNNNKPLNLVWAPPEDEPF